MCAKFWGSLVSLAIVSSAMAYDKAFIEEVKNGKVSSMKQAIGIATKRVKGTVIRANAERGNGGAKWGVYILDSSRHIRGVELSAKTGKIEKLYTVEFEQEMEYLPKAKPKTNISVAIDAALGKRKNDFLTDVELHSPKVWEIETYDGEGDRWVLHVDAATGKLIDAKEEEDTEKDKKEGGN